MSVSRSFSSYTTIALVMLSVLFIFIMPRLFYFSWVLVVLDAIGLGFFAVDAGIKAISQNFTFVGCFCSCDHGRRRNTEGYPRAEGSPSYFGGHICVGRICRGHMHVVPLSDRRRRGGNEVGACVDFLHTDHFSIFQHQPPCAEGRLRRRKAIAMQWKKPAVDRKSRLGVNG